MGDSDVSATQEHSKHEQIRSGFIAESDGWALGHVSQQLAPAACSLYIYQVPPWGLRPMEVPDERLSCSSTAMFATCEGLIARSVGQLEPGIKRRARIKRLRTDVSSSEGNDRRSTLRAGCCST